MGDDLAAGIEAALEPTLGIGVKVTDLRPLTSGASRSSWRFDAAGADGPGRAYVLQHEMLPGLPSGGGESGPLSMKTQARLLEAADRAGVPVARVVASGDLEGRQFIIAEWVDGEALPPKLLRDPDLAAGRERLMEDCAQALAGIHSIPVDGLGLARMDRFAVYRDRLDVMDEPRPVLELAYRWLLDNRPPPAPDTVVHGDFRLGNLMVGRTGLTAVLDWEMTHVGDPNEDVAWATIRAWRFDRYREPGMFPETDAWIAAYNRAAGPGRQIDPASVLWWQVAGTWFWAVISAMQARRHLDGWVQSLEHAVIGRRVCESEWDLLGLLP